MFRSPWYGTFAVSKSASHHTCGGDVATETEEKLVSFTHGDLGWGFQGSVVALGSQFGQLPAEVSAGQSSHQDGVRLVLPSLEDDGDRVAAHGLLQLLRQGGELARLQRGEETHYQQSAGRNGKGRQAETEAKLRSWAAAQRLDCCLIKGTDESVIWAWAKT